eukprot:CAMPEP_0171325468 /NCGR_PEP_ID=MMETSP0816-20121228/116826_1 /TAXON_ID=420281 /ORGANISM="Proboscia inermis, Strain CCAP1064/1" /LENGTH=99 /DNA_ID=CAMNT_0011824647 /DNA_START=815 /DNA_END=1111 /DNA_ORIENTATION=-
MSHFFVFITEEWEEGYKPREQQKDKMMFGDNVALADFMQDVKLVLKRSRKKEMLDDGGIENAVSGGIDREELYQHFGIGTDDDELINSSSNYGHDLELT